MSLLQQFSELKFGQYLDVSYIDNEGNGAEVIYSPQPPFVTISIGRSLDEINITNIISSNIENYIRAIKLIWGSDALNDPFNQEIIDLVSQQLKQYLRQGYKPKSKRITIVVPNFIKKLISKSEKRQHMQFPRTLLSLQEQYEDLESGEYLDVSYIDDQGFDAEVITDFEPPLFGNGIKLVSDNIENFIRAIEILWGPEGFNDEIIKASIDKVTNSINQYQSKTGYIHKGKRIKIPKLPSIISEIPIEESKVSEILLDINYIEQLPDDAIIKIALELNLNQIIDICSLSNNFNRIICYNENFWQRKYFMDFNEIPVPKDNTISTFKSKSQFCSNEQNCKFNWKELYKNTFRRIEILKFILSNFSEEYDFEREEDDDESFGNLKTYGEFITFQWNQLLNSSDRKLSFLEESIDLINNSEIGTLNMDYMGQREASRFLITKNGRIVYFSE